MIIIKTDQEVELIRQSNQLVLDTLAEMAKIIKPGVTTAYLDEVAEKFIRSRGGVPGFLGYNSYPKTLCTSVNAQVVHGIPSGCVLNEGDIVSIDCGAVLNGYNGDSAYTFAVGTVDPQVLRLMQVTKDCLFRGAQEAIENNRIGDIGNAVQSYAELNGFSVVREMVGHGLGKKLHEEPEVPNYGKKGSGVKLKRNMVLCIEPMINFGARNIVQERDGWTIRTSDRKPSAHYELPVAVGEHSPTILGSFDRIEEILNNR
ncbi:MAG TPA: type I methionyl aminopeptidase [Bacteroidales bacterium]|nr:type I methionyl aminopeptidase [Bacteroidales bacterium]